MTLIWTIFSLSVIHIFTAKLPHSFGKQRSVILPWLWSLSPVHVLPSCVPVLILCGLTVFSGQLINYWYNKYGWGCSSKRCLAFWFKFVQCTHQKWICCTKMTFHAHWVTSALEDCIILCFVLTRRVNFWENTPVLALSEVEPFCCRWPPRNSRPASAEWTPAWGRTSLSMWSGCSVAACAAAALWAAACGPWSVLTKKWVHVSSY